MIRHAFPHHVSTVEMNHTYVTSLFELFGTLQGFRFTELRESGILPASELLRERKPHIQGSACSTLIDRGA